jgi:hypothetical protein
MPMTLIGSGAVLVVLLGALALHYRHDTKPEPLVTPTVVVPPKPAVAAAATTPRTPAAGAPVDVFGGAAHDPTRTPVLAEAPEAPKPRAQLTVQTTDAMAARTVPTTAATATTKALASTTTTATTGATAVYKAPLPSALATTAKPDATAVVERLAGENAAKSPATAPGKARPLAAATRPVATAAKPLSTGSVSGAVVQIGAFSSALLSDKGWGDVVSAMGGAMGGKTKRVEVVEKDGKTFYRTSVTGFASRAAADAFCEALTAKGKTCFAKGS